MSSLLTWNHTVVNSSKKTKRGLSLNFEMFSSFLSSIYSCNRAAKWVFSIANNHACDTSRKNSEDVRGVEATIDNIGELFLMLRL